MGPVLIVTPFGADAANTARFLRAAEIDCRVCSDLDEVARALDEEAGPLILAEEATVSPHLAAFEAALARQPAWSDLPIVLIASPRDPRADARAGALRALGSTASAVVLERPLRVSTMLAAVRAALASRARQFQVRDLLAERQRLLDSLEAKVAERTRQLQQTISELEDFSYSVSHDLRAPLRALYGYARALREDYKERLDETAGFYIDRIAAASERMDRLTQDLLAYTRVSRDAIQLQSVDLDEVLADVLDHYPTLTPHKSVVRIQTPLGSVLGHTPSLVQCFSNLLENAVKFARPSVPLRVQIKSVRRHDRVRVTVRDNGRGIHPEQQKRIFGLFERAVSDQVEGTGIGLAIVRKAAERMNGAVGVASRAGRGACFWLELPAPPALSKAHA